ncbi:Sulf_transp domain-containing protein [Rubrivivax sp. A210]|uniref:YeeE/YedE family protein n=1 Tax=Rubrivivax sp. A210 TaxID=2772301 RepID=UPI00191AD078|nr:YeeE/YedE family protein [Rubrivivax sp. A210]CAD5372479.1 Sulf_transp domain-containing protein [Rubrivivax sp. A210]
MQEADLPGLVAQVLGAGFALGVAFGALAQRTHFCTMGALADVVYTGDWARMRMWLLAVAVAMLGFNAMVAAGWVRAADTVYAGPRLLWLSHALGGLLFGFGMVLASGCGSKTLVRMGGGSLKALVVFLVLATATAATLRGITAVARVASVDTVALTLATGQDLPSLLAPALGMSSRSLALALGGGLGLGLMTWVMARPEGRRPEVLLGGLGVGALVLGLWWVSGRLGHLDEHPLTLEPAFLASVSGRMESFSFVAPTAYTLEWLTMFSDKSRVLNLAIVTTLGVVLGSAAVALATGRFRWEGFAGTEDSANHLAGAVLMGVGGVTAMGCTVGQGISGVSTLALGSFIALAAILAGGVLGLRYLAWRLERQA